MFNIQTSSYSKVDYGDAKDKKLANQLNKSPKKPVMSNRTHYLPSMQCNVANKKSRQI